MADGFYPQILPKTHFLFPVFLIITMNLGYFFLTGRPIVMESFLLACTLLGILMWFQKVDDLTGIMNTAYAGMKGVMPAVVILALAYCINTLSQDMGTAAYVVSMTEGWMTPNLIPVLAFVMSAFISFATGSAYGTYAIMVPIVVPLAYQFGGQEVGTLVYSSFGAVLGGGVFGDHCSPLSDTTVLSSMGAACDHIDHVKTQIPTRWRGPRLLWSAMSSWDRCNGQPLVAPFLLTLVFLEKLWRQHRVHLAEAVLFLPQELTLIVLHRDLRARSTEHLLEELRREEEYS
ncbi:MAG: hypothetical protein E2P02_05725 [Acidobacteria bacterium]|nr:MAG: hypothetical protein E2P02_05725 [Acidobacteriota bacterium]